MPITNYAQFIVDELELSVPPQELIELREVTRDLFKNTNPDEHLAIMGYLCFPDECPFPQYAGLDAAKANRALEVIKVLYDKYGGEL